ncbi:hypothetical protein ACH5RR_026437 [Cinchona calisaya]|uniref:Uncharacterized protein n=1 Tax=Cinchona calisaya TaxID=153742 RepID=A0ABD2Z603_9GENT
MIIRKRTDDYMRTVNKSIFLRRFGRLYWPTGRILRPSKGRSRARHPNTTHIATYYGGSIDVQQHCQKLVAAWSGLDRYPTVGWVNGQSATQAKPALIPTLPDANS